MKKHFLNFLIILVFFLIPSSVIPQKKIDHFYRQVNFEKLDKQILKAIEDLNAVGLAVGIIKDGKVVFEKGYGFKNFETKDPVTTKTLFAIASCSKAFTAASIGMLVDESKLDWNDRVIDRLPNFKLSDPYATREMRIVDLLSHRSVYNTFDGDLLWYGTNYSRREVLKRFELMPAKKSLRIGYGYSNIMFIAAGEVIENISGKSWGDFVKEKILNPLEMKYTTTTNSVFNKDMDYALPHINRNVLGLVNYDNVAPAASLNSNVEDLLKWLQLWLNKGKLNDSTIILKEKTIDAIFTSQTVLPGGKGDEIGGRHFMNTAMGWFLSDYTGRKLIQHSGGLPGFLSRVTIVPEANLGIVVLTNDESPLYSSLTNYIIDLYLTEKDSDEFSKAIEQQKKNEESKSKAIEERNAKRITGTSPSQALENYAGIYEDKMYGKAKVTFENGELNFVLLPAEKLFYSKMTHWHYDSFNIEFADPFLPEGLVTFEINNEGKVRGFKIDLPNPDFHFYNYHFEKID